MKNWYAVKYLGDIIAIQDFTQIPSLMEFDYIESYNNISDYEIVEVEIIEIKKDTE